MTLQPPPKTRLRTRPSLETKKEKELRTFADVVGKYTTKHNEEEKAKEIILIEAPAATTKHQRTSHLAEGDRSGLATFSGPIGVPHLIVNCYGVDMTTR